MSKEYEEDVVAIRCATCYGNGTHKIKIIKYNDSSMWILCPYFGWFETLDSQTQVLGCKERKRRCTWFFG